MSGTLTSLQRAYRWIATRPHTVQEMRVRLHRYASEEETEAVIDRLLALRLLDDLNFSAGFASYRLRERGFGPLRIRSELLQRGVSEDVVARALELATAEMSFEEAAVRTARKLLKARTGSPGPREYRRLVGRLSRAGFSAETVRKALRTLGANDIDWSAD